MGYDAEVIGVNVESGVSSQPFSDEETIQGAINRAVAVLKATNAKPDQPFDYGVGLEGGVVETEHGLFLCNWGAVVSAAGTVGVGGGHRVQLPPLIVDGLRRGEELGTTVNRLMHREDVHKNEGAIGILTRNRITRDAMFRDVVICAFARFLHPDFYGND
jgi:inosine/xanthosine triphosphatase